MGTVYDAIEKGARHFGHGKLFRSVVARARRMGRLLTTPTVPLHREESIEPFFIVGSGRCGTTLLRRLLQASPDIHIPPENWTFEGCLETFRAHRASLPWRLLADLLLCRHVVENHRWFEGVPAELRSTIHQLEKQERSLARFYDEVYRYHGRYRDATFERWGDKTPINGQKMEALLAVFPNARFVHMLRDGVDVVHSMNTEMVCATSVVSAAKTWTRAVTAAHTFAEQHPDRLLTVRYERMCRSPEEVLREVCTFIDVPYSSRLITRDDHHGEMQEARSVPHYNGVFGEISTDPIGKGRKNMSREDKATIRPHISDALRSEGYDPIH